MRWLTNPVLVRESRARMRGRRVFVVLAVVLAILWFTLFLIYAEQARHLRYRAGESNKGAEMMCVIAIVQTIMIGLLTPAFACSAFTSERERLTFDLLISTSLKPWEIVFGKLLSSLYYIFLLIVAGIPIMSFCILFGGLSPWQVLAVTGIMLLTAVFFASVGLWFSARMRRTATAAATTYGIVLFVTAGVPFLALIMTELLRWRFGLDQDVIMYWSTVFGPIVPICEILIDEAYRHVKRELNLHMFYLTPAAQTLVSALLLSNLVRRFRSLALRETPARRSRKSAKRESKGAP